MKKIIFLIIFFCSVSVFSQTYKVGVRGALQYKQHYAVGPNFGVHGLPNYEFLLSENILRKWNWSMQLQQGIASHFYLVKNNNTGKKFFNPRAAGLVLDFTIKKSFFNNDKLIVAPYFGARYFYYYDDENTSMGMFFGVDFLEMGKFDFYLSCYIPWAYNGGMRDVYDLSTRQLWGSERFVISAGAVYKLWAHKKKK